MKRFNAAELVILILTCCIAFVLVMYVVGVIIYGPERASVEVRTALIDLMKFIIGGIFGGMAAMKVNKNPE